MAAGLRACCPNTERKLVFEGVLCLLHFQVVLGSCTFRTPCGVLLETQSVSHLPDACFMTA
jgi:hypothetical protein